MEQPKKKPGLQAKVMLVVIILLVGMIVYFIVGARKEIGRYRVAGQQHLPMLEWAIFINDMRCEEPGYTLEEIIDMQMPFGFPGGAKCRVLAPEEQTGSRKGCAYIIECGAPNPFAVLSDGTIEVGPLLKN
jgi:hypothetical protein